MPIFPFLRRMKSVNRHRVTLIYSIVLCVLPLSSAESWQGIQAAIIDSNSCLAYRSEAYDHTVFAGSKCVCRLPEPWNDHSPEWFDKRTNTSLATGKDYAVLTITPDYRGNEDSIVCRERGKWTTADQTVLPPISDYRMGVRVTVADSQRKPKNGVFYTNKNCSLGVSISCRSLESALSSEMPRAHASISVYSNDGHRSEKTNQPIGSWTENGLWVFDFRFVMENPGHAFVKCLVSNAEDQTTIPMAGFSHFQIVETSAKPVIITSIDEMSVSRRDGSSTITLQRGTALNISCIVPDPWGTSRKHQVMFSCGHYKKINRGYLKTSLWVNVTSVLSGRSCHCEIYYICVGKTKVLDSHRLIHVDDYGIQETDTPAVKETLPSITDLATTSFLMSSTTEDRGKSVSTSPFSGVSVGKDQNEGSEMDKEDDDSDELQTALIVAGAGMAILIVAVVFFFIGRKVGLKSAEKRYSTEHQPSIFPTRATQDCEIGQERRPVDDDYADNINIVGLKPNRDLVHYSKGARPDHVNHSKNNQVESKHDGPSVNENVYESSANNQSVTGHDDYFKTDQPKQTSFSDSYYSSPGNNGILKGHDTPGGSQSNNPTLDEDIYESPTNNQSATGSCSEKNRTISSSEHKYKKQKGRNNKQNVNINNSVLSKLQDTFKGKKTRSSDRQKKENHPTAEPVYENSVSVYRSNDNRSPANNAVTDAQPNEDNDLGQYAQYEVYQNQSHCSMDMISNSIQQADEQGVEGKQSTDDQSAYFDEDRQSKMNSTDTQDVVYESPSSVSAKAMGEPQSGNDDNVYENDSPGIYERPSSELWK